MSSKFLRPLEWLWQHWPRIAASSGARKADKAFIRDLNEHGSLISRADEQVRRAS